MTRTQIENKLADLDFWLTNNPHHADRATMQKDKMEYERKLAEMDKPG